MHPETLAQSPDRIAQPAWPELPQGVVLVRKGKEIRLGLRVNLGGAQIEIVAGSRAVMTYGMSLKATTEERRGAVERAMALFEKETIAKHPRRLGAASRSV